MKAIKEQNSQKKPVEKNKVIVKSIRQPDSINREVAKCGRGIAIDLRSYEI